MSYSVNQLITTTDCDTAIAMAASEKRELVFKRTNLEHEGSQFATNTVEVSTELANTNTELAAQQTIFATLPAGKSKDNAELRIKRLEARKKMLEMREDNYGAIALLEKENELARVTLEITEMDNFIAALQARKAAIQ